MAKFTDDYFSFPIKIYNSLSLRKARQEEESTEQPVEAEWVQGVMKLPVEEIFKISWHDGFSREREIKDVVEIGFDSTVVYSNTYGDFICTLNRKEFEDRLNKFMERWQKENQLEIKQSL